MDESSGHNQEALVSISKLSDFYTSVFREDPRQSQLEYISTFVQQFCLLDRSVRFPVWVKPVIFVFCLPFCHNFNKKKPKTHTSVRDVQAKENVPLGLELVIQKPVSCQTLFCLSSS